MLDAFNQLANSPLICFLGNLRHVAQGDTLPNVQGAKTQGKMKAFMYLVVQLSGSPTTSSLFCCSLQVAWVLGV